MNLYVLMLIYLVLFVNSSLIDQRKKTRKQETFNEHKYIIRFEKSYSHNQFITNLYNHINRTQEFTKLSDVSINHYYHKVFHGIAIVGVHYEDLNRLPGVVYIAKDNIMSIRSRTGILSWGLDRIDQINLPLTQSYSPYYSGQNVDVYIVDTGLDTTHIEFTSSLYNRMVQNVYNAYGDVTDNTDDVGHGTHCAGTIGGNNVGVSPGVNIYGLKVLDSQGSGATSTIVNALEEVISLSISSGRRSIVSMSLGGPCEDSSNCQNDPLVLATEALADANVVVSVAAGNEGCNGCNGSPNAAPRAINVGATDRNDKVTYFSNYGECIDIYAPGLNIWSACASYICGNNYSYLNESGTSMACPHAAGVIAQILEKEPSFTPVNVSKALACDSAKYQLHLDSFDTISKNLLLQIPRPTSDYSTCQLGEGCTDSCNDHGVCLFEVTLPSSYISSSDKICYCNYNYYGSNCQLSADPNCLNGVSTTVSLIDSYGDGWTYTSFGILNHTTNQIVDYAYDSLCYGDSTSISYCLAPGIYDFVVTHGYYPMEVAWIFCNVHGGAPTSFQFLIDETGNCEQVCNKGSIIPLSLYNNLGDGWNGAYYAIYNNLDSLSKLNYDTNNYYNNITDLLSSRSTLNEADITTPIGQIYGGTLVSGSNDIHSLCLPIGCSYMIFEHLGNQPSEVTFDICGYTGNVNDIVEICIDPSSLLCISNILSSSKVKVNTDNCSDSLVTANKFSLSAKYSWENTYYSIFNQNTVYINTTLPSNIIFESNKICLPDGCYQFQTSNQLLTKSFTNFISICDSVTYLPFDLEICVEKDYALCYGIEPYNYIKSYIQTSSNQYFFISSVHESSSYYSSYYSSSSTGTYFDELGNIHGINYLYHLQSNSCYSLDIGGGKIYNNLFFSETNLHMINLCNYTIDTLPFSSTICINGKECLLMDIIDTSCSLKSSLFIYMIDLFGDGWNSNSYYKITSLTSTTTLYKNSLSSGGYGRDILCLVPNKCYRYSVIVGYTDYYYDEMAWIFCGKIGYAPVSNYVFCVNDYGCAFELQYVDDDSYDSANDDDFPRIPTVNPTFIPSLIPTLSPSSYPTLSLTQTLNPTVSKSETQIPTSLFTNSLPTANPTNIPITNYPTLIPSIFPTIFPSYDPSSLPSSYPTANPTIFPTFPPTTEPSSFNPMEDVIVSSISLQFSMTIFDNSSISNFAFISDSLKHTLTMFGYSIWYIQINPSKNSKNSNQITRSKLSKLLQNQDNVLSGNRFIKLNITISIESNFDNITLAYSNSKYLYDQLSNTLSNEITLNQLNKDIPIAYYYNFHDTISYSINDIAVDNYSNFNMFVSNKANKPVDNSTYYNIVWNDHSAQSNNHKSHYVYISTIVIIIIILTLLVIQFIYIFKYLLKNKKFNLNNLSKYFHVKKLYNTLDQSAHSPTLDSNSSHDIINFDNSNNNNGNLPSIFRKSIIRSSNNEITADGNDTSTIIFNPIKTNSIVKAHSGKRRPNNEPLPNASSNTPMSISFINITRNEFNHEEDDVVL